MAPCQRSISGLTGFFTITGINTPRSASAKCCTWKGLTVVLAPIHNTSMSYFRASSICAGSATSTATRKLYCCLTSFSHFNASSPLPSKEPGRVLGFHTPARNKCTCICDKAAAVSNTWSRVSALQGPAIKNGLSFVLKKDMEAKVGLSLHPMKHRPDHAEVKEGSVILIDKPRTWTSFDAINAVKRLLHVKIGHCGTLDP